MGLFEWVVFDPEAQGKIEEKKWAATLCCIEGVMSAAVIAGLGYAAQFVIS